MLRVPLLKMDSLYTPDFFKFAGQTEMSIKVDFALPASASTLKKFLRSSDGAKLKSIATQTVTNLGKCATDNGINTDPLQKFQKNFIEYSGFNEEENVLRIPFYRESIPALIRITEIIATSRISLVYRKNLINNLISSFGVCAPGTHTNIMNAYLDLIAQLNIPMKLMTIRKHIAEQYIEELLPSINIETSYEIHYVNAVLHYFSNSLGITPIHDNYENICSESNLEQLYRSFESTIDKKLSPERVLDALVAELDYEAVPLAITKDNLARNSVISNFEEKLNTYGEEGTIRFFFVDDLMETNDDYTAYQTSWRASYVLNLTLMQRLRVSGLFTQQEEIIEIEEVKIHLLLPRSLKLSYVQIDHDPSHKIYQPFLTYCVDAILNHDEALLDFIHTPTFSEEHRVEIAVALIQYLASLPKPVDPKQISILSTVIVKLTTIEDALIILDDQPLLSYIHSIDNTLLIAKNIKSRSELEKIIRVIGEKAGSELFLLMYELGIHHLESRSLFWHAARLGNVEAVKELWQKNSYDLAEQDKFGDTPLYAASELGHTEVVKVLLNIPRNKTLNKPAYNKLTPLHTAVHEGHVAVIKLLLTHKAKIATTNETGESPLYTAVSKKYSSIVRLLLEKGADFKVNGKDGRSLYSIAVSNSHRVASLPPSSSEKTSRNIIWKWSEIDISVALIVP